MNDLLQFARKRKNKAKNLRDRGKYEAAIVVLDKLISDLNEEFAADGPRDWKSRLASELADCYGLSGGIQRRWALQMESAPERRNRLLKSIQAYDQGYQFESDTEYGIVDSYNCVNRLISRILIDPSSLSDEQGTLELTGAEALNVRRELENADAVLYEQLKAQRRGDVWALADRALVDILLERADPASAYSEFYSYSPPTYCYTSALATIKPLAKLPLPVSEELNVAAAQLEKHIQFPT